MISIIIPVYNSEKYLRCCLDSIMTQTYKDFECILVDDGSTDDSGKICDEYGAKNDRFKIIHKGNGGVSSARNRGINYAQGQWIYFCDADDKLADNRSLENLLGLIKNADLAVGGHNNIDDEGNLLELDYKPFKGKMSMLEYVGRFFSRKSVGYQGYLWTKLFKKSIIEKNNLQFDESIKFAEDMLFITQYCCCDDAITVNINSKLIIYDYYHHQGSAMDSLNQKYNPNFFTDFLAFEKIQRIVADRFNNKRIIRSFIYRLFISGYWNLRLMKQFHVDDKPHKDYIEKSMSRFPKLKAKYDKRQIFQKFKEDLLKLPIEERVGFTNIWLHSKDCKFFYLNRKWKIVYILSMIGCEKGVGLIKSKLMYNNK